MRVFTFRGELEHVATVERWEHPGGVGDVQQRGTAFSRVFSPSWGRNTTTGLKQTKITSNMSYWRFESGHFSGRIIKMTESVTDGDIT